MLLRIVFFALIFTAAHSLMASESTRLVHLEKKLRQQFSDLGGIDYRFDNRGNTLVVGFRTRKFLVHVGSMVGERSHEAHEVVGPGHAGFLVRIHLQDAGTVNQARVPQTIREPYWNTDLNVVRLDAQKQVYVAYSYGAGLDGEIPTRLVNFWKDVAIKSARADGEAQRIPSTLEGTLKVHPKFAYRFYIDGLAEGQTCGLKGVDAELKDIKPGARIRVRGILLSKHFNESAHGQQNSALARADYIYMDVKSLELLPPVVSRSKP